QKPFTILSPPHFKAHPATHATNSQTFIILSFQKPTILIGATEYPGEIKNSIFSLINYLLPHQHILSIHSSPNLPQQPHLPLFFPLSPTPKTTLSATPTPNLI
ncbi:phosphoenolpyruvate carboxykinase (ATP), partial [Bacillus sp. WP8]|uniref:phosphoenolpyruvate carboxykinase (ATP) n=1 Tax=Bacillus sp. WP8 TaxID=756828 RepID=UPI00119D9FBC